MTTAVRKIRWVAGLVAIQLCVGICTAQAPEADDGPRSPLPAELEDVNIVEKLNGRLPLDGVFVDHNGKPVKLADFFDGKRPVILTLNFFKCPMLCGLQFTELVEGLKQMDLTAGTDFRIVTVSFDPQENEVLAYAKRRNLLSEYGRPAAGGGWDLLTSPNRKKPIQDLLDSTGVSVKYVGGTSGWAHKAALIVCTPDGRISRYLAGIQYEPKTLKMSLVEASEGKIGSLADQLFLFCFHYDGVRGMYAMRAMGVVQLGGLLVFAALAVFMISLWRRERRPRTGFSVP